MHEPRLAGGRRLWEVAHDVTLGAWFGGALMGAIGLNGATMEVDDHTQRTRVANAGWFRWAPIVGLSVVAHTTSALALGRLAPVAFNVSGVRRRLSWLRTGMTVFAVLATVETGWSGRRVARAGDVPVATAVTPIKATPDEVASAQRRLRVAQCLVPTFTAALWVIDAFQDGS